MCVCVYTVYTPVYRPAGWLNFKECGGLKTCPPRDAPASWEASEAAPQKLCPRVCLGRAGRRWGSPGLSLGLGSAAKHTRNFQVV